MIQVLPIVISIVFFVLSIALSTHFEIIGFRKGYGAAGETYKDWDKGFHQGWEAGRKIFTDYDQGFEDGWQAAKEEDS